MTATIDLTRRDVLAFTAASAGAGTASGDGEDDGFLPDFDFFDSYDFRYVDGEGNVIAEDPSEIELGPSLSGTAIDGGVSLRATGTAGTPFGRNDQEHITTGGDPLNLPEIHAGTAHIESDSRFRIFQNRSGDYEAQGPDGGVAESSNPKDVIHACDYDGAHLVFDGQTTYEYRDPPIGIWSDDVTMEGPISAVLKLADGQIPSDEAIRCMNVYGDRFTLSGLTTNWNEPNQEAVDKYGLWFAPPDHSEGPVKQTRIEFNRSINAVGDAYGHPGPGSRVIGCRAEGFTEDGIDFKNKGGEDGNQWLIAVGNVFVGNICVKIQSRGGGFKNGAFVANQFFDPSDTTLESDIGTIGRAVNFGPDAGQTHRNFIFDSNIAHTTLADGSHAFNLGGDGSVDSVQGSNNRIRCGGTGIRVAAAEGASDISFEGGEIRANSHPIKVENATPQDDGRRSVKIDVPVIANNPNWGGQEVQVASTCTDVEIVADLPDGIALNDSGTGTIFNGEAIESASAEVPQRDYPPGTMVDFTDSGDGTGTAYYVQARDGSWRKIPHRDEGTESGAIALDTPGVQTVSASYSLPTDPQPQDISAVVTNPTQTDAVTHVAWVDSIGSGSFTAHVNVGSESATAGATADLSWSIEL